MLIRRVILLMIDVVMHGQGWVTWRTTRFLLTKLFWQSFCISTCLDYDHLEHYGANAQNTYRHIHKSYCSRPIHTKRCYWAVILERIESRTLESHKSLVCLVCQCLSWKTYIFFTSTIFDATNAVGCVIKTHCLGRLAVLSLYDNSYF